MISLKVNKIYFLISISVFFTSCNPFTRSLTGNVNVYKTQSDLKVQRIYDKKNLQPIDDSKIYTISPQNSSFIRFSQVNDTAEDIIRILPWTKFEYDKIVPLQPNENTSDRIHQYYFKISEKNIQPYQKFLATEKLTAIPLTIPIKYRWQKTEELDKITVNASVNYGFGYRIKAGNNPYKENYFRLLIATGIGTDKYVPKDSINVKGYKATDNMIWTIASFGITYESGNRFNFGFFYGWDRMFGSRSDWFYQNKPWLGFGLGYKFK